MAARKIKANFLSKSFQDERLIDRCDLSTTYLLKTTAIVINIVVYFILGHDNSGTFPGR